MLDSGSVHYRFDIAIRVLGLILCLVADIGDGENYFGTP